MIANKGRGRRVGVLGRVIQAAGATVILAAIIAGIPYMLIRYVGNPLPNAGGAKAGVTELLSHYDARFIFGIITIALWLCWAYVTTLLIIEAVLTVRDVWRYGYRVDIPQTGVRAIAAILVSAVLAGLLLDLLRAGITKPVTHAPLRDSMPAAVASATPTPRASTPALPHAPTAPSVERVAVMTPSSATKIQAGPTHGNTVITVKHGDDLWDLAAAHLGDPHRWREIYTLNRGKPQPHGGVLQDPDLIKPGWILQVPTTVAAAPSTREQQPEPPPTHTSNTAAPTANPPVDALPQPQPTASPTTTATPQSHQSADQAKDGSEHGIDLATGEWITAGLGVAIASLLHARRLNRRRRAALRHRVPAQITPTEQPLRTTLRQAAAAKPTDVPGTAVTIAERADRTAIGTDQIVSANIDGPGSNGVARALIAAALSSGHPARTEHAATILITHGTLQALAGAPIAAEPAVQRRLRVVDSPDAAATILGAAVLYRSRLAEDQDPEPTPPISFITASDATAQLDAIAHSGKPYGVGIVRLQSGQPDITVNERGYVTASTTNTIPLGSRFSTLSEADLTELLRLAPDAAYTPESLELEAEAPAADRNPPQSDPEPTNDDLVPEPATATPTPQPSTEDAPEAADLPDTTDAPATARLLGPPTLIAANGNTVNWVRGHTWPVLAYLAVHPQGATLAQLTESLWPDIEAASAQRRVSGAINSIRTVLREATDEQQRLFIKYENRRYRIVPEDMAVDVWHMQRALAGAAARATPDDRAAAYRAAAQHYQGEFAEGIDAIWAEPQRELFRRQAVDAQALVAEHLAKTGDDDAALSAFERAIEHDPVNEELYQRIMKLQGRLGRTDAVRRTFNLLEARLHDQIDADPSAATRQLAQSILQPARQPASGPAPTSRR